MTGTTHYNLNLPDHGDQNWDTPVNANFESIDGLLYNRADTNFSNITTTAQEALVDLLYPVGSIYIGTTANCPLAAIKGTWTLQSSGIVKAGDIPCKGNGMTLGLTNGTYNHGLLAQPSNKATTSYALYSEYSAYGTNVNTAGHSAGTPSGIKTFGITTDSTKSGIVADTSSLTLSVNIWQRTA